VNQREARLFTPEAEPEAERGAALREAVQTSSQ